MKASKRATLASLGLLALLALGLTTLGRHQTAESSRTTKAAGNYIGNYEVYDTASFGPPPDITAPPPEPPDPTPTPVP